MGVQSEESNHMSKIFINYGCFSRPNLVCSKLLTVQLVLRLVMTHPTQSYISPAKNPANFGNWSNAQFSQTQCITGFYDRIAMKKRWSWMAIWPVLTLTWTTNTWFSKWSQSQTTWKSILLSLFGQAYLEGCSTSQGLQRKKVKQLSNTGKTTDLIKDGSSLRLRMALWFRMWGPNFIWISQAKAGSQGPKLYSGFAAPRDFIQNLIKYGVCRTSRPMSI